MRCEIKQIFESNPTIIPDKDNHEPEERLNAIGSTEQGRAIFVVFTIRLDRIRPISAATCTQRKSNVMRATTLKKIPTFKTDKQAEQFVAKADLSEYDLRGRPMSEAFPQFASQMKRRGRPKSNNSKQIITIRLDRDVLERLKADGSGWQTRVNAILRKAMGLK